MVKHTPVRGRPIYQQIVDDIRAELLEGHLRPGDPLPPVRVMAERWACTPGTVQQAYRELARQGLLVSRPGQGSRIGAMVRAEEPDLSNAPLRGATLANRAEAFLLEVVSAGYTAAEADAAFRSALDRWRAVSEGAQGREGATTSFAVLRFAGSHDPAISYLASHFDEVCAGCSLEVAFTGSLGGLIAVADGTADLSGSHLWDAQTSTYNEPFVRRLLPGRRVALVTLAHRRLGLVVARGNPGQLASVTDLARPGVRFINRQRGTGTRVWLDAQLHRFGIDSAGLRGYEVEARTHGEVAKAIAEGRADTGLAVETAALSYGLGFVFLATEPYDLVIPEEGWGARPQAALIEWLQGPAARTAIQALGGYDTAHTGEVRWIE